MTEIDAGHETPEVKRLLGLFANETPTIVAGWKKALPIRRRAGCSGRLSPRGSRRRNRAKRALTSSPLARTTKATEGACATGEKAVMTKQNLIQRTRGLLPSCIRMPPRCLQSKLAVLLCSTTSISEEGYEVADRRGTERRLLKKADDGGQREGFCQPACG